MNNQVNIFQGCPVADLVGNASFSHNRHVQISTHLSPQLGNFYNPVMLLISVHCAQGRIKTALGPGVMTYCRAPHHNNDIYIIYILWLEEQTTDTVGVASGLGEAFIEQK